MSSSGDSAIDDAQQLRSDFPITKKTIYMNNGSVAPTPVSTIKAVTAFMLKCAEEGPDAPPVAEYITSLLNELRTRVAHLINCEKEEVVLVQSTTEGINTVANGIGWKKGDVIIARGGRHEHYANYLPWLAVSQRRGVAMRELPIASDDTGSFDLGELEQAAASVAAAEGSRTGLVTMSHALYNTGAIMPLEQVGRIARENNLLFCVDAAQSAGTIPVDVRKIGCHFMAFPGFKWLCGPTGIGILYCSREAAEQQLLTPPSIGGESATLAAQGDVIAPLEMPAMLQAGFRNYPGAAGLESSLRYVLRTGIDNIRRKNMKVAEVLRSELGKIAGVRLYGPEDEKERTSFVTFTTPLEPSVLVKKLEQGANNIIFAEREIGGGRKAVRAAPHFFNSEQEASVAAGYVKSLLAGEG